MAEDRAKAKRNLPRKPERYPVDIGTTFRIKGESDWYRGTLVNLSTGGFCLQTSTVLKTGSSIEFLFDTVDRSRQKHRRLVLAKVVWKRLTRYGVQFSKAAGKKPFK